MRCLEPTEIDRYVTEEMNKRVAEEVTKHLSSCQRCKELVAERRDQGDPEQEGRASTQSVSDKKLVKVQCGTCNARYGIPEERLKGKVLKIRCKECKTIIEVRPSTTPKSVLERGTKQWFVVVQRQRTGPFTEQEIRDRFQSGEIKLRSYCWRRGFAQWERLKNISDFEDLLTEPGTSPASTAPSDPLRDGPSTLPLPGLVIEDPEQQEHTEVSAVNPGIMEGAEEFNFSEPDLVTDPEVNKQAFGVHLTGAFDKKTDAGDDAFQAQLRDHRGREMDPQEDEFTGSGDVATSAPDESPRNADNAIASEVKQELASTVRVQTQQSAEDMGDNADDIFKFADQAATGRQASTGDGTSQEESDTFSADEMASGFPHDGLADGEFDKHMKGQRHENSVLFSLGHLKNIAMAGTPKTLKAQPQAEKQSSGFTGLFDVRSVASPASPILLPADPPQTKGKKLSTLVGMMVLGIIIGIGILVGGVYLLKPEIIETLTTSEKTGEAKDPLKVALNQAPEVMGEGKEVASSNGPRTAPLAQEKDGGDGEKNNTPTPAVAEKTGEPITLAQANVAATPGAMAKPAAEEKEKPASKTSDPKVATHTVVQSKRPRPKKTRNTNKGQAPSLSADEPGSSAENGEEKTAGDTAKPPGAGALGEAKDPKSNQAAEKGAGEGKNSELDKLIDAATPEKKAPTTPKVDSEDEGKKPSKDKPTTPDPGAEVIAKTLDQHQIATGMRRAQAAVNACGERFKRDGEVKIKVTIDGTSQRIIKGTILGDFAGTPLGSCVLSAAKTSAKFPKFSDLPLTLEYPFFIRIKTDTE